jgi:hypothetical protein
VFEFRLKSAYPICVVRRSAAQWAGLRNGLRSPRLLTAGRTVLCATAQRRLRN